MTELDWTVDGDTYTPAPGTTLRVTEDKGWQPSVSGLRYSTLRYTR
ncbi:hypothetical protein ACWHLZ_45560 [Streptomyces chartreusis]